MENKPKQPLASSFFQPISRDEYTDQLRCTVPIGCAPPLAISQEEKLEKERLRNNLKMKASRDRKKAVEILEGKRDLEGQVIKPSRNAFGVLSQTATGSNIYSNNMALTSNYSQKRIRKHKISPDSIDLTESQFLSIKRQHKNWFYSHLWPTIELAAKSTNYSSRGTVKHLQSCYRDTNLYDSLAASTVNDWLDHTFIKKGWNKRTKKLIEEGTY